MMTNRRGARATGDGLPERTKLAAVLAAVKVRPGSVSGEGSVGVPADLDGVCARAAAVIRGRGGGRACGAVELRNGPKRAGR
jgi:hypothetical protein